MQHSDSSAGTAQVSVHAVVMAVLAVLFWASAIVVGRAVHEVVPPVGLTFWRSALAAVILLPFAWRHLKADRAVIRRRWKMLAVMAAALWTVGSTAMFLGLHFTTAVNAGLVNATEPAVIVLFAWIMFRDMVTPRQAVGIAVSFCGITILILGGQDAPMLDLAPRIGDLLVLLAVTAWAFYVVLYHRYGREMHPLTVLFAVMFFAAIQLLPLYLLETAYVAPVIPNAPTLGTILYLTVVASILAVLCWNRAILGIGHSRTGLFSHLMPVFTVVLAMIFLGESLHLYHLAGVVLIALGLYLTTVAPRRDLTAGGAGP
jgi:drug/metabolite transporter (DMT)-like permease